MSIIEARLFELQIKGDRLDEINAEEVLTRRAAERARLQALGGFIRRIGQQLGAWVGERPPTNPEKFQPTHSN